MTEANVHEKKYREMLLPTVRIRTTAGVGSGVVVQSNRLKDGTYENVVLTADHVVTDSLGVPFHKVTVSCYWSNYGDMISFEGTPLAFDTETDLAAVILKYDGKMPYVAKIWPKDKAVRAFQETYAVGCTLGVVPPFNLLDWTTTPEPQQE